jgi:hypothetical protein
MVELPDSNLDSGISLEGGTIIDDRPFITTKYNLDNENRVREIHCRSNNDRLEAHAWLNEDQTSYEFYTLDLDGIEGGGENQVFAPNPMSLANCILAANVFMGLIPPHNFDPIPCPNKH